MRVAKATLPVGPESMLERVVRLLGAAVDRVVVVAGPGQPLPPLGADILVVRDEHPGLGPLAGLETGLSAIADHYPLAYVTGCDTPLLVPQFVFRMIELIEDDLIAVPVDPDRCYALAAVYRTEVLPEVRQLLAATQRRTQALFERVASRRVDVESLRDIDPQLATLTNVNRPADYFAVLESLGLQAPREIIELLK